MALSTPVAADEGFFLMFENEHGSGDLVSANELGQFMSQASEKIDVVFVAACESEGIGKTFHRYGASHVICVMQNSQVLDSAAIDFTKSFYDSLFKGEEVCAAYDLALQSVTLLRGPHEARIFKLFKKEDQANEF